MASIFDSYLAAIPRGQRDLARTRPLHFLLSRGWLIASALSLVSLAASAASASYATTVPPVRRLIWVLISTALIATFELFLARRADAPPT